MTPSRGNSRKSAARKPARPKAADLRRGVEAGERSPLYLLHGEEDFTRDSTCQWLIDRLSPEVAREFNIDVFYGDRFELRRFVDLYQAYPLMASHRLLVLKACDRISTEQCRSLEDIAVNPAETTVFIAVGGRVDLRRKLWQQFARQGLAVEFRVPYDNQIPHWVSEHAKSRGIRLETGVADRLSLYVGNNLRELAGELEKLATYAGENNAISLAAVDDLVGVSRSTSIFEFTDAVGQRRNGRAQELLHSLLDQGEEPLRILLMISRHLQLLLKARQLAETGVASADMAKKLGISPHFLGSYRKQAAALSRAGLWAGLQTLVLTDRQLKSLGRKQQRTVMDLCLSQLAGNLSLTA